MTRRWSSQIREWVPWAGGMTWRSIREPEGFAYVFFEDRCPNGCFEESTEDLPIPPDERNLDVCGGRIYLEGILASYRVALM